MSPPGLSVPSSKINCISRRFRLVLLPLHCLTPQTLMSSIVWLAELKCSATGSPGDRLRMLRRCSPKRSRRRLPVSPMYMLVQRRQVMQYTTFSDWQVKRGHRNSTLPQHFWCKGNTLGKAWITKIIKKYLNQVWMPSAWKFVTANFGPVIL